MNERGKKRGGEMRRKIELDVKKSLKKEESDREKNKKDRKFIFNENVTIHQLYQ